MIISLTPTKNEAWIVGFTGNVNSRYCDVCCYYDQLSSDKTVEIVSSLQNSLVRRNQEPAFNEAQRQLDLIAIARELQCHAFVALDADEALFGPPDVFQAELKMLAQGTTVYYEWINVSPDGKHVWSAGYKRFGFVDDGTLHRPALFHSERVPNGHESFYSDTIKVIHFQYINRARFCTKHIEYLKMEFELHGDLSRIELFIKYSHMIYARKQPTASMQNLVGFIRSLDSNDHGARCADLAEINDHDFVRRLVADREWLLLYLITRLVRFAGYRFDQCPRFTAGQKSFCWLLEFALHHPQRLFSRALIRFLKVLARE